MQDGMNWYIYCVNNPTRLADPMGLKLGDLFSSPDEAFVDFGNYINKKSIEKKVNMLHLYIMLKMHLEIRCIPMMNHGMKQRWIQIMNLLLIGAKNLIMTQIQARIEL